MIEKCSSFTWSGRARLLLTGPDGQRRAGAAIGGPIIDGQVAFRIAGEIARSDGLVYNTTLHRDGDRRVSETLRGKLLVTPDVLPNLRIGATYLHDRHQRGTYQTEFDAPYTPRDRISTEDFGSVLTVKSDIATLEAGYDLGSGFNISSVTNYSNIRSSNVYDQDRTATPGQVGQVTNPSKTFQQELRLSVKRSWVQGLVGAYYLRNDNRAYFYESRQNLGLRRLGIDQVLLGRGLPQSTVDTVLNLYGGAVPISNNLRQPRLTKNYAGFADLTFPITDGLRLIAGLRYDHESQDRGATQNVTITVPLPDPGTVPAGLAPIVTQLTLCWSQPQRTLQVYNLCAPSPIKRGCRRPV
ncbi:TonB-dependent receptor [Sphingomonas populi]|uniref:TonB-dependent receptor n=1 Tax=Sphingomonas populi TaxID=2484750 RepID=A0A4Q6XRM9_9SPHN|nr:TonB-dependent receptor [Sphingomonas populi]RZF59157.1 TonB-dependent receptor [Sphingomonas populi]